MKSSSTVADFDSATAMLRALSNYLKGEDFPLLGAMPRRNEPVAGPSCSGADANGRWSVARKYLPQWYGEPLYAAVGQSKENSQDLSGRGD